MADIKQAYGASVAMTITLASLVNNAARESTEIDNIASDKFEDVLVQVKIKSGATGTLSTGFVNIYAYGTVDETNIGYANSATGVDAAITLTSPPNVRLIGILNVVANNVTYISEPLSVAVAFGGIMPEKWGIIIENKCGGTLSATGTDHAIRYRGIYHTSA